MAVKTLIEGRLCKNSLHSISMFLRVCCTAYLLSCVLPPLQCRYTLKYTYPYAYYLEGDRKPLVSI